jgi:2-polyprenyl-6-methoxyphenol hydroxylase-like FAD-dependent oxidoreductase
MVRTGCAVSAIDETDDGVRVFLQDGSFEDGDVVVGCDGVASTVRQIMWDKANAAAPDTISAAEKRCETAAVWQQTGG